jgi:hypothetical protein
MVTKPNIQGSAQNDPVFDTVIKYLFQLQYYEHTKRKTIAWRFILCESNVQYDHHYVWQLLQHEL